MTKHFCTILYRDTNIFLFNFIYLKHSVLVVIKVYLVNSH